MGSPRPRFGDF